MSEALYYPYTQVQSSDSLKAMILYFDKIHVISPNEASIGNLGISGQELEALHSNNLIKYISPADLLERYDRLITKSVLDDLTDHRFLTLAASNRGSPWELFSEKVPSSLADHLLRKYFVEIPNFYDGEKATHFAREGPHQHFSESSLRELIETRHAQYSEREEIGKQRDRQYHEFRCVNLPFEVGESLMINHAICASSSLNLTPITDTKVHHDFFMFKLSKMSQNNLVKKILKDYRYIKNTKNDLTAINIISETVPVLSGATINDVLEFRDENKDSLKAFRVEMGKIATGVQSNYWDSTFHREIVDIVDSKVKPSLEELKASVESTKEKFIRIFKKGAQISPLPIVASVAPGCVPQLALLASAGVIALSEYLEHLKRERLAKRNGFAYLFNMDKALRHGAPDLPKKHSTSKY